MNRLWPGTTRGRWTEVLALLGAVLAMMCGTASTASAAATAPDPIIGGLPVTDAAAYPWMAQVQLVGPDGRFRGACAGSLLDRQWVITAGHCIGQKTTIRVQLGTIARKASTSGSIGVAQTIRHPDFRESDPIQYDAALLRLEQPVTFTRTIQPIALPSNRLVRYPGRLITVGWGLTNERGKTLPETLQQITQREGTHCYRSPGIDRGIHVCTLIRNHKATCYGDSGGPLMRKNHGRLELVGLTSGSVGSQPCDAEGHEDYFARVSGLVDWIRQVTGLPQREATASTAAPQLSR
ncbi:serine protease [Streptomyces abikoensis]|uniref:serine protease n=1 Tax=Streptomyces abikoensis TaxID=97398 RepID=UPI0036855F09